ncbi:MAG: CHRD domain-containing protein [Burkholderiales bacterium]|nr:CHRD domain-containing protein [Burkholderiales bacterium]
MIRSVFRLLAAAALVAPLAAQATLYDFTATLKGSNEVPGNAVTASTAGTGFGSLQYNDAGTPGILSDDSIFVLLAAANLTGPATDWHIHGAATTTESAGVRVNLKALLSGTPGGGAGTGTLAMGGLILASASPSSFSFGVTGATATNAGHPAMSLLAMLQSGLGYFNVHTAASTSGEIRGQLVQVTPVPEPGTYAMLAAGLLVVGAVARRRQAKT